MVVVVVEYVADGLVEHREETGESSQFGVVHDVFQGLSMFQALRYHGIGSKVRLQHCGTLSLNLFTQNAHQSALSNISNTYLHCWRLYTLSVSAKSMLV